MKETSNKETLKSNNNDSINNNINKNTRICYIKLPYKVKGGEKFKECLEINPRKLLLDDIVTKHVYTSRKLGSKFQIEDKAKNNINLI